MKIGIAKSIFSQADIESFIPDMIIDKPIIYGKLENVGVAYEEEQTDVIKHSESKPEIDFGIFE